MTHPQNRSVGHTSYSSLAEEESVVTLRCWLCRNPIDHLATPLLVIALSIRKMASTTACVEYMVRGEMGV